jgi:peptidoglycan L-alanyl-D-glutamate endopeptidase CwlK
MMFQFGNQSEKNMEGVDADVVLVMRYALRYGAMDFSVVEGIRGRAEQDRFHTLKKSRVRWPHGKHNVTEWDPIGKALDCVPFVNGRPSWNHYHCSVLAGGILLSGGVLGVSIRWGGNWDMDGEPITDQEFQDLVHYELH